MSDNRTRCYSPQLETTALHELVAALTTRVLRLENEIQYLKNSTQVYGNVAVTQDVSIGGVTYTLADTYPHKYVPKDNTCEWLVRDGRHIRGRSLQGEEI